MGTAVCALLLAAHCDAAEPSFSCRRAANTAERLICNDAALAALDRKLADVFGAAGKTPSPYTDLGSSQREFTRVRNDCWQSPDFRGMASRKRTCGESRSSRCNTAWWRPKGRSVTFATPSPRAN